MPEINQGQNKIHSFTDAAKEVAVTAATGAGLGAIAGGGISLLPGIGKSLRTDIGCDTFISAVRQNDLSILPKTKEIEGIIAKTKEYLQAESKLNLIGLDAKLGSMQGKVDMQVVRRALEGIFPKGTEIPINDDEIYGFIKQQLKNENVQHPEELQSVCMKLRGDIKTGVNEFIDNISHIKIKEFKNNPNFDLIKKAKAFYKTSIKGAAKSTARAQIIGCTVVSGILAMLTAKLISSKTQSKKAVNNTPSQNAGAIQG